MERVVVDADDDARTIGARARSNRDTATPAGSVTSAKSKARANSANPNFRDLEGEGGLLTWVDAVDRGCAGWLLLATGGSWARGRRVVRRCGVGRVWGQ